jgi:hypothetical protein
MSYVEHRPEAARWMHRLARWSRRLRVARLDGLVGALLEAAGPLSPLGAQLLWIAQPTLGLFAPREDIVLLARLLDDPDGMTWLREQLTGPDDETDDYGQQ